MAIDFAAMPAWAKGAAIGGVVGLGALLLKRPGAAQEVLRPQSFAAPASGGGSIDPSMDTRVQSISDGMVQAQARQIGLITEQSRMQLDALNDLGVRVTEGLSALNRAGPHVHSATCGHLPAPLLGETRAGLLGPVRAGSAPQGNYSYIRYNIPRGNYTLARWVAPWLRPEDDPWSGAPAAQVTPSLGPSPLATAGPVRQAGY